MAASKTISVERFHRALRDILSDAVDAGKRHVDVLAGDLHRTVADPAATNRMPACCQAMMNEFDGDRDEILESPPKGQGSTLKVRYALPRRR